MVGAEVKASLSGLPTVVEQAALAESLDRMKGQTLNLQTPSETARRACLAASDKNIGHLPIFW